MIRRAEVSDANEIKQLVSSLSYFYPENAERGDDGSILFKYPGSQSLKTMNWPSFNAILARLCFNRGLNFID